MDFQNSFDQMLQEIWSFSGLTSKLHLTVKISSEK